MGRKGRKEHNNSGRLLKRREAAKSVSIARTRTIEADTKLKNKMRESGVHWLVDGLAAS